MMNITIKSLLDLKNIRDNKQVLPWLSHGNIVIKISLLAPEKTQTWEKRLNDTYHDCGCAVGSVFGIASIVAILTYLFIQPVKLGAISGFEYLVLFFGFFVLTAVGKIIGINRARKRLRIDVGELFAEFERTNNRSHYETGTK